MYDENKITYFGETDSRGKRVPFGIKAKDRLKHMYVIGKTGMGKSTLLENMAIQDIQNGNGMAFIDPHGGTAEKLLEYVPEHRVKDVVYLAPFDIEYPISFNVMEDIGPEKRHLVLSGLMSAFMKLFGEESFSDRMQYILQNTILALLEYPGASMLGINRMLSEKEYRNKVIANITDPSVKTYWTKEYAGYTERFAADAIPAIQNKIGQFTSNPLIRNIIGQEKSSFDFRNIMDEGKIMIINLSKGKVGESNANLIGSMIITKIYLAAMSRADAGSSKLAKLPNFYLYVDEFQSFANKSFADILSEARKYKLNLTIAHQYIEQMEEEVRDAVFGNVGSMIVFRVGALDAELLEKEFAPTFTAEDLVNLGIYQTYLKLMIDGVSSSPFSARTLPPIKEPEVSYKDEVIKMSRLQFAKPREQVEKGIADWNLSEVKPKSSPGTSDKKEFTGKTSSSSPKKDSPAQKASHVSSLVATPLPGDVSSAAKPKKIEEMPVNPFKDLRVEPDGKIIQKNVSAQQNKEIRSDEKERDSEKEFANKESFVSLDALKKDKKPQGGKGPTEKNLSDLKATLASVLKKAEGDKIEKKSEPTPLQKPQPRPVQPVQPAPKVKADPPSPPPPSKNTPPASQNTKEIPEDVLKKMLDVK